MLAAPPPAVIVVQPGDNLWKIAEQHGPTEVGTYWRGLINANPMPDPSLLTVGQKLHAPTAADKARPVNLPHIAKAAVVQHAATHPMQAKVHTSVPIEKYAPVYKRTFQHKRTYKHVIKAPTQRTQPPAVQSSGACGGDLPPCFVVQRESRGNIRAENPTSTASGKWQFVDGTWNNYGGYHHASDAPESVQDARAREVWAGGAGASAWAVR